MMKEDHPWPTHIKAATQYHPVPKLFEQGQDPAIMEGMTRVNQTYADILARAEDWYREAFSLSEKQGKQYSPPESRRRLCSRQCPIT